MKESKDQKVQAFLEDTAMQSSEQFEILQKLREIVFNIYPKVGEKMMYGGIMFNMDNKDFGGIFAYSKHISFEFSNGVNMKDVDNMLEGSGKQRRHIKIKTFEDIKNKNIYYFVKQIL